MNILVTAGPTREHIDPVRFFSNASSGRMGILIAEDAARRSHDVSLVLGPTPLEPDDAPVHLTEVTTAEQMRTAVFERFDGCDMLIMTAAVCDLRPTDTSPEKVKKDDLGEQISVEPTPDILHEAGQRKTGQTLIGFAVESRNLEEHGRTKFRSKNLDLIVLNRPEAMGSRSNRVHLFDGSGSLETWPELDKADLAGRLVERFVEIRNAEP